MVPVVLSVSLALLIVWFGRQMHIRFLSSLGAVPSANLIARFSKIWLLWIKYQAKEHQTRPALHRELGPVVRVALRSSVSIALRKEFRPFTTVMSRRGSSTQTSGSTGKLVAMSSKNSLRQLRNSRKSFMFPMVHP